MAPITTAATPPAEQGRERRRSGQRLGGLLLTVLLLGITPAGRCEPPPKETLVQAEGPDLNGLLQLPDWLQLQLQLQAQPLANPAGGTSQGASWIQQLSLDVVAGPGLAKPVEQWSEADHWRSHGQLMLVSGNPNWNGEIGAAFALQSTAHPTGLWLTEASIERKAGAGPLGIKAGVFSLNPGFIEAPVLNAYVHSALNNTLNLNVSGLPINPYSAPGIQLQWQPEPSGRWGEWRYGAFLLDPEFNLAALFGVNPDLPQLNGHSQLLQWSYDRLPGAEALQQPIRSGGQQIARQLPPPLLQIGGGYLDNSSDGNLNTAIAATLTLAAPLPLGLDNRLWLGVSGGFEWDTNPVPLFLGGGWLSQGIIQGRPLDVLALGIGGSRFSPSLSPGQSSETVLELNYSWLVSANLSLQPVLQLILNPDGVSADPILALGLGLTLQF
ncbi:MAG: carbohydrate porin [Synechococcus sp.]|nr:carbohydrate porin [Synechococcus sp.]